MKVLFFFVFVVLVVFNIVFVFFIEVSVSNVVKVGLFEGFLDGIYIEKLVDDGLVVFECVVDVNIIVFVEVVLLYKCQGSFGFYCDYD